MVKMIIQSNKRELLYSRFMLFSFLYKLSVKLCEICYDFIIATSFG